MAHSAQNGSTSNGISAAARKAGIPNPVKDRTAAGILTHAFSIKMFDNIEVVHFAAAAGYDAVLIDLEHGTLDLGKASQLSVAALQVGLTPIVRVPQNSSEWISKALDGGAQAVIVPHVKSAKEAAKVVQYAKFTPIGERSATSGMPLLRYASIPAREANVIANELTTVICMIETQGAVDDVDSIADVPGVDMLLIGSADLTADMGIPGEFDHPRLTDAYAKVSAAAKRVSVNGRFVSVGAGGINGRPDLIEKLATTHDNLRFAMSGADSGLLLGAMRKAFKESQGITERVGKAGSAANGQ